MKNKIVFLCLSIVFPFTTNLWSQTVISDTSNSASIASSVTLHKKEQAYRVNKGRTFIYEKPERFGFITNLPHDAKGMIVTTFKKESIKPLLFMGAATLTLMLADGSISNGVKQFARNIHFHSEEKYKDIINLTIGKKNVSIYKVPENLNTAFYQTGQGFPGLLIGAGLFTYGKIYKDYRAVSTAGQLAESFLLMGASTQLLKRITGRQSPVKARHAGGDWHFFPSFKSFQTNTSNFDAFPSGHLATMMSSVTILAENYAEKRYIKPVGYSLMGLLGLSMINNDVHWASDYPMAIALGYVCAKQVVKRSRKIVQSTTYQKKEQKLFYTFNYTSGRFIPGVIYQF